MHVFEHQWFSKILRPSRYLGGEVNSVNKEPYQVEVSIALAFPDVYEIGMSHSGLKILYHILNDQEWLSAERVFAPWVDLESELRKRNIPLASLESGRPLSEFDIVGFSLQHELCYTNVLSMLDLAQIPFLSQQRGARGPLIIAGGPACFNPEPVADIFDALVVGDGEEVALTICRTVREWKREKTRDRDTLLRELSNVRGIYVPSFFEVHYDTKGVIRSVESLESGYTDVRKAIVSDLNHYPFPSQQLVPFTELVHDRFTIEIARGCSRGCRFCQAGVIYRPVRERHPQEIVRVAERGLTQTGFEDLSLLSLSSGDYSCLIPLLKELMARVAGKHVAVSFSSLRADSVASQLIRELQGTRKMSFTVAPEAGSQKLRDIINKGLTEDQILLSARQIYEGGWNLIKLYFMIGLPYEEEDDVTSIVELSKKISRLAPRGRCKQVLNVSIACFVPKAHTPFQWMPQLGLEESKRRISMIRKGLQGRRVKVKWNRPEASWLEGVFSRGDRRLTAVLVEAWSRGARFDSWTEQLNVEIWNKAFERRGLEPGFYLYRERDHDEILPWDHIKSGLSRDFLLRERNRAAQGVRTHDCREQCSNCGVCNEPDIAAVIGDGSYRFTEREAVQMRQPRGVVKRYRLHFTKLDKAQHLSHLELSRLFIRAFGRAGLDLVYSSGYHPMPKVSFAKALPVGIESLGEIMDIQVEDSQSPSLPIERLNRELPTGVRIVFTEEVPTGSSPPQIGESHFHIRTHGSFEKEDLDNFLRRSSYVVTRKHGHGERSVDIRSQVKALRLVSSRELELVVAHGGGPEMKPADIVKEIWGLSEEQVAGMKILKTKAVLK